MRRTKIVATLGPATSEPDVLKQLIDAGLNVARLNYSHGTPDDHRRNLERVREAAEQSRKAVACMQDLSGPKTRTGKITDPEGVELAEGSRFTITTEDVPGTGERVSTTYEHLPQDVNAGDRILLDDGLIQLSVKTTSDVEVVTEVAVGGVLKSQKGINLPGVQLSVPALTDKDRRDVLHGLEIDVDFVALSFVHKQEDIEELRAFLREHGREDMPIIAKIERPEAIDNLDSILEVANGVMVARGDLGVELSPEEVPTLQKEIIRKANYRGRLVITATQMLESMVASPVPTRAEASDVANAILDGTDALMLSAETATGKYPVEAVTTMARIAAHTDKHVVKQPQQRRHADFPIMDGSPIARAVALAARRAADELDARYIAAFTESGATVRQVSHTRPLCPILGFTTSERVYRRLAVRWGVTPLPGGRFETTDEMLEAAVDFLKRREFVQPGDIVITVCGTTTLPGATNMMKILKF